MKNCALPQAAFSLTFLFIFWVAEDASAQILFTDAAPTAGLSAQVYSGTSGHGGGVNWIDYDNDGWADIFFVNGSGYTCNLYRNEGDGTFSNQTALLPPIDSALELTHSAYADYDNDGDADLYIGVAKSVNGPDGPPNILLKNLWMENGGTTLPGQPLFTDVAAAAGVQNLAAPPLGPEPGYGTFSLGWLDYDRDGCVDLYVTSMAFNLGGNAANDNTLYRNKCDGTFEDATVAAGLTAGGSLWLRPTLAFASGLLNDDLWPDLYVVNAQDVSPYHHDFIFMNNGDGTFAEVTSTMPWIGDDSGAGMGLDFADIDRDGDWDIYISDLNNPGNEPLAERNVLYLGNPGGTWSENSAPAAGVKSSSSWGVSFFDADQDGYEDLYVGVMGDHELYRNNGNGTFSDVSASAGMTSHPSAPFGGRGSAFADYDHDGDLDLAAVNLEGVVNLYTNVSSGSGNYLQIIPVATTSNRSAIGTLVEIVAGGQSQMRQLKGGVSAHSQDESLLHFGIGSSSVVSEIEVSWPSGIVQRLFTVPANQVVTVRETAGSFLESGEQVVFEAESFDSKTLFQGQSWTESTEFAGFSGGAAMEAGPDIGTRLAIPRRGSPTMNFATDFATTGAYYVWVRAWAPDAQARLLHVGLDGAYSTSEASRMRVNTTGAWAWTNSAGHNRALLNVGTAGVHAVNVAMSQDGLLVDKVLLTTDPDFVPSGEGPAESPRDGGDTIVAEAPINAAVETAPTAYGLAPSYPNPFTGATTIPFATPADGAVNLAVYDLLGRRVATLVDEVVAAGSHEVNWTATDLPSGVYFVRLTAGSFVATQRVTLMR